MKRSLKLSGMFESLVSRMAVVGILIIAFVFYLAFANPFYSGGYAKDVEKMIPQEHASLKALARDLAVHNDSVHEALKTELSGFRGLNWYMSSYPERFNAPSDWFESVAETEGIPAFKISDLLQSAEKGPVSTDEAAKWLLTVSAVLEEEKAARSQESGLQALRGKNLSLPNVPEGMLDGR